MSARRVYFHVDLDAFFASVEQLDHPQYRGKPVIVGGSADSRGVVSTCSYEARAFGVRSAMPTSQAMRLCPQAIFVRGRMERYCDKSAEVMAIFREFSPEVQRISIDEAFLDMTGTERLFGPPGASASRLKERVTEETGLTVSVGIAPNRYLAKIASGLSKPNGLVEILPGEEESFMLARPLKDVWGVGEKTRERLEGAGLKSVRDIKECPEALLATILGQAGAAFLYRAVRGEDNGIFAKETSTRSMSSETTFPTDVSDAYVIDTVLLELAEDLFFRMLDEGVTGNTVHVKIRYADFTTVSCQETTDLSIRDSRVLFEKAQALFRKKFDRTQPVRLVGLAVHGLKDARSGGQIGLFPDLMGEKRQKVELAVYDLSKKRGKRLVKRARLLDPKDGREE